MKLTLAIASALAGFAYLIVKTAAPDFPISEEEFLKAFLWLLGALGVVFSEPALRAYFVKRGFESFRKTD